MRLLGHEITVFVASTILEFDQLTIIYFAKGSLCAEVPVNEIKLSSSFLLSDDFLLKFHHAKLAYVNNTKRSVN